MKHQWSEMIAGLNRDNLREYTEKIYFAKIFKESNECSNNIN